MVSPNRWGSAEALWEQSDEPEQETGSASWARDAARVFEAHFLAAAAHTASYQSIFVESS